MSEQEHPIESEGHSGGARHGGGRAGVHGPPHGGGHEEHHEGAPEWIISFADNVALLMGFFVMLLAMNMRETPSSGSSDSGPNQGGSPSPHVLDMVLAIRESFHNPPSLHSTDPNDQPLIRRLLERRRPAAASPDNGVIGDEPAVQTIRDGDVAARGGVVMFEDRSAALGADGRRIVRQIAEVVRGRRFLINVSGHVSAAEAFGAPDHGMLLSHQRAVAVAQELEAQGVDWRLVRVIACGDNRRVVAITYDATGHRANQRVEVEVTDEEAPEDPFAKEPPKGPSSDPVKPGEQGPAPAEKRAHGAPEPH